MSPWSSEALYLYVPMCVLLLLLRIEEAESQGGGQSLFQCQTSSNMPGKSWTPNIPSEYFNNRNVLTPQNTSPARFGFTYIFKIPAQGSGRDCTGNVTAIQVCYKKPVGGQAGPRELLQFLVMDQEGTVATVRKSFPVAVNPQAITCSSVQSQSCCETVALLDGTQFELIESSLIFGLMITQQSISLLAFAPTESDFNADQYQLSLGIVPPSTPITLTRAISDQSLMLMRFEVGKESNYTFTETVTGTSTTIDVTEAVETTLAPETIGSTVDTTTTVTMTEPSSTEDMRDSTETTVYLNETTNDIPETTITTNTTGSRETTDSPKNPSETTELTGTVTEMSTEQPTGDGSVFNATEASISTTVAFSTPDENSTKALSPAVNTETATTTIHETTEEPAGTSTGNVAPPTRDRNTEETSSSPSTSDHTKFPPTESSSSNGVEIFSTKFVAGINRTPENDHGVQFESVLVGSVVGGVLGLVVVCLLAVILVFVIRHKSVSRPVEGGDVALNNLRSYNTAIYDEIELNDLEKRDSRSSRYIDNIENNLKDPESGKGNGGWEVPSLIPADYMAFKETSSMPPSKYSQSDDEDIYMVPGMDISSLSYQLRSLELPRKNVWLDECIGSGHFGTVYCGKRLIDKGMVAEVAVKTLKKGSNEEDRVKFLQEAAIMGQFKHPNVVTMYGIVTDGEPVMIVLEILKKGDLRLLLCDIKVNIEHHQRVEMDEHTLLSFCRQVASGMTYLSNKGFVHRDLAARNILVSEDDVCKIADFGMSRELMDEDYYVSHGGKVPIRWTAPEAVHFKKYSTASDVWSYGVVMYEIWSLGHKPFEGITNTQVLDLLDSNIRLAPPPGCPRAIYSIMMSCWHPQVLGRPSFVDLNQQLSLPDSKLLHWSTEDKTVSSDALRIGAKIPHGQSLFKDLQTRYKKTAQSS